MMGLFSLNRILSVDPTYVDTHEYMSYGKLRPPHDFDQDVTTQETPLNQWLHDGSSKRSHHHRRQVYQYYLRNKPTV